jgi:mono/diheme cytochrome c family protein
MLRSVDRVLAPITWLAAAVLVVMLFAGPAIVAEDDATPSAQEAAGSAPYATNDGEQLFTDTCGSCHTLEAAGTSGGIGPDLTGTELDAEAVAAIVRDGRGTMPSFGDQLSAEQIDAIAAYVADAP